MWSPMLVGKLGQDEETQESVAMKKIENAFEHITCLGSRCIFLYNVISDR